MTNQDVHTGKVKYFNPRKRFGFIIPDVAGDDIFVHYNNIFGDDRQKKLRTGDQVEYFIANDENGNTKAVGVKLIGRDPSAAAPRERDSNHQHEGHSEGEGEAENESSHSPRNHSESQGERAHSPRNQNHGRSDREHSHHQKAEALPAGNLSEAQCFANFDANATPDAELTTIAKTMCVPTLINLKDKNFKTKSPSSGKMYSGQIEIIYDPKSKLIEMNSLSRFLNSFSRIAVYHEQALEIIYKKISAACDPHSLEVVGKFTLDNKTETTITVGPESSN